MTVKVKCGHQQFEGQKFCGECGARREEPAPEAKPEPNAGHLRPARDPMEAARRHPLLALGMALAIAAVVAVIADSRYTPPVAVSGDLTVLHYFTNVGEGCQGSGPDQDIAPNAPVTLRDYSGAPIAQTTLGFGTPAPGGCDFSFDVEVPQVEDVGQIQVGNHSFSIDSAHSGDLHLNMD